VPRSAASIQTEITATEACIARILADGQSISEDGTTLTLANLEKLQARVDHLYIEKDRANGTGITFASGSVSGLGGSC
jgi:hypothetical protein